MEFCHLTHYGAHVSDSTVAGISEDGISGFPHGSLFRPLAHLRSSIVEYSYEVAIGSNQQRHDDARGQLFVMMENRRSTRDTTLQKQSRNASSVGTTEPREASSGGRWRERWHTTL